MNGILAYLLGKRYTDESLVGVGALKGAPCEIKSIVKENGRNTITFLWKDKNDVSHESQMIVLDGTPIYVWTSGDSYTYGDLVIYASAFYRCITPNSDVEFDDTKWNEIGSPDGNYDIVQNSDLLPPIFTSADRKLYYSIEDSYFWLWNGEEWEAQVDNEPVEDGTGYVSSGALFNVKKALESSQAILTSVVNTNVAKIQVLESGQNTLTSVVNSKISITQKGAANGVAQLDANGKIPSEEMPNNSATKEDISTSQIASTNLLKDTVGWTGKNILVQRHTYNNYVTNGITWNTNADGSISANGTATDASVIDLIEYSNPLNPPTGDYIVSGGINQNQYIYINGSKNGAFVNTFAEAKGTDVKFAYPSTYNVDGFKVSVRINSGQTVNNVKFYPMLRRADIADDTYEPYHESVETMYEEEIHGVNLLENTATSQTINGVTFTVNSDGSITANGTATNGYAQLQIRDRNNNPYNLPIGSYIGNGCPTNGSASTYQMRYIETIDGQPVEHRDYGEGVKFDVTKVNNMGATIYIANGATVNNLVFKPMLRKAEIEDSTYRPYNEQAIQNQLNAQGVLGAKNLLENKLSSKTKSGITVTVNTNKSVTLSGTNSSSVATGFVLSNEDDGLGTQYTTPFKVGESYIFSGGGTGDPYDLQLLYKNGTYKKPTPNKPFILENDVACVYFSVAGNATVNATVYPMIRLASDPDDTYVPYAMTNRELTENKVDRKALIATDCNAFTDHFMSTSTATLNSAYKQGLATAGNGFLITAFMSNTWNVQFIFSYDGHIYKRTVDGTANNWTQWATVA